MFSLFLSLSISQFILPPTFFCLSTPFSFYPASLCLFLAAPGAMANHLIPNALLRPHGTNNPYNTLLGESAVYNNPLGMYNTQGVLASFHSLTLWLGQCCFIFTRSPAETVRLHSEVFVPGQPLHHWGAQSNRFALNWNS